MEHPRFIYKIVDKDVWEVARKAGSFDGVAIDLQDKFIHFSTKDQVRGTAKKYFSDVPNLVVATIDTHKIPAGLKWEKSRDEQLFPHLYSSLSFEAVVSETDLVSFLG